MGPLVIRLLLILPRARRRKLTSVTALNRLVDLIAPPDDADSCPAFARREGR